MEQNEDINVKKSDENNKNKSHAQKTNVKL